MPENNTCVCCGRVIPEGKQICLQCSDYDDQQRFEPMKNADKKKKRIKQMIDCKITDFVWNYVCSKKTSCPSGSCTECVLLWLNQKEGVHTDGRNRCEDDHQTDDC